MNTIMKMENLRKIGLAIVMLCLFILVSATVVWAQSGPPVPAFPGSPDPAPIDGGLVVLAAAGGAYAYRKLIRKKE